MTAKELIKILKKYPADTEVLLMKDWDNCPISEEGLYVVDDEHLIPLSEETNIAEQTAYLDDGLDWVELHQVIIG